MNNILGFLGIAKKARLIEIGEEPTGEACSRGRAKLVLVASDAAENSARRAGVFAERGKTEILKIEFTKLELGEALGRKTCAMLAVTDAGIAAAIKEKLN